MFNEFINWRTNNDVDNIEVIFFIKNYEIQNIDQIR